MTLAFQPPRPPRAGGRIGANVGSVTYDGQRPAAILTNPAKGPDGAEHRAKQRDPRGPSDSCHGDAPLWHDLARPDALRERSFGQHSGTYEAHEPPDDISIACAPLVPIHLYRKRARLSALLQRCD